jgi:hypothetical protein
VTKLGARQRNALNLKSDVKSGLKQILTEKRSTFWASLGRSRENRKISGNSL